MLGSMRETHQITRSKYAYVLWRLAECEKIARKLKVAAPTVELLREFTKTEFDSLLGQDREVGYVEIAITDPALKWDGWTFLAAVDHLSGVVRSAPDAPEGLAVKFGGSEGTCDHCGLSRDRRQTIVVAHEDGRILRIGGSCVKKFLGGFPTMTDAIFDFLDSDLMDDEGEYNWAGRALIEVDQYLIIAAAMTRIFGYEPSSFDLSTRKRISEFLNRGPRSPKWLEEVLITADDREIAKSAREWAKAHDRSTDFGMNLSLAASADHVSKTEGILAFVPEGYVRSIGESNRKKRVAKASDEIVRTAVVEGKIQISGTVLRRYKKQTEDYGTQVKMIVLDDRGFEVVGTVPASIIHVAEGDRITFEATVKQSPDKPHFGFFSRPTKADFLDA